jgi:D-glycero-alpha-D-manno-heptose-7-phosphate kinase
MIIARSPLRVTFGGGGTDLPSYYERYGGFLISAAIDKYVYVSITRPFTEGIFLKYSELENVSYVDQVHHNLIREALRLEDLKSPQIEITTLADIPSGTGLGSSGSFITALLKGISAHRRRTIEASKLAEVACKIEIEILKEPVGKQDQYIAAYGGIKSFEFKPDGSVVVEPIKISIQTINQLEDNLLLFFTGFTRSASNVLKDQDQKSRDLDAEMIENLHFIKELGYKSRDALEAGDLEEFARLMDVHWRHKQKRTKGISKGEIDEWYELGMKNGALGGKLVGAGGGGFLMFYVENKKQLRAAMMGVGLQEVRFRFDFDGSKIILS